VNVRDVVGRVHEKWIAAVFIGFAVAGIIVGTVTRTRRKATR
jgi:hypothetical protein